MFHLKNNSCKNQDINQIPGSYIKGWKIALSTYEEIKEKKKSEKHLEKH